MLYMRNFGYSKWTRNKVYITVAQGTRSFGATFQTAEYNKWFYEVTSRKVKDLAYLL